MSIVNNPFKLSESAFQNKVIDIARLNGWLVHHTRPAQVRAGKWATPVTGDIGLPDLILAHPKRGLIFAELKTEIGRLTPGQKKWVATLHDAGVEIYVWRPSMMDDIIRTLNRKEAPK